MLIIGSLVALLIASKLWIGILPIVFASILLSIIVVIVASVLLPLIEPRLFLVLFKVLLLLVVIRHFLISIPDLLSLFILVLLWLAPKIPLRWLWEPILPWGLTIILLKISISIAIELLIALLLLRIVPKACLLWGTAIVAIWVVILLRIPRIHRPSPLLVLIPIEILIRRKVGRSSRVLHHRWVAGFGRRSGVSLSLRVIEAL